MVVIARTLAVAHEPRAVLFVQIFADVGPSAVVLALHVELHLAEEDRVGEHWRGVVVQVVGHGGERLRRSEGPDGAVPLAPPHSMRAELGMPTLGGGQSVGCRKAHFIGHLLPCHVVMAVFRWQVEVPRNVADGLADLCRRVTAHGFKEAVLLVPQLVEDERPQRIGFGQIAQRLVRFAGQRVEMGQGIGVTAHVRVDGGPCILLLASAGDAFLHAVLHVALPVESVRQSVGALPTGVFFLQPRFQGYDEGSIAQHLPRIHDGPRVPRREFVHLLHRLPVVAVVPCAQYLVQISGVAQPAGFHHVVANGAGDEVVAVGVGTGNQEFGHAPACRCALQVLAQRPPAEVVDVVEILVGTVEQRNVLGHPVGGVLVGDVGQRGFPLFLVEGIESFLVSRKAVGIGWQDVGGEHGRLSC